MKGQQEFLAALMEQLEACGIPSMVCGSVASGFHGEPRATNDIDLVVMPSAEQLAEFVRSADASNWYVSEAGRGGEPRPGTMLNVIDSEAGWKADLVICRNRPFSAEEFRRRIEVELPGVPGRRIAVATAEDVILSKLEWARQSGSDRHFRDALGVAVVRLDELDRSYLQRWAGDLGVADELERVMREASRRRE